MGHPTPCDELEEAKLEFGRELTTLTHAVNGLKEQYRQGNRNTLLAVAAIGFVGVLVTVVGAWFGQKAAIDAGASQAHIGAAQAIQSAQPSTDSAFFNGYRIGAQEVGAQVRDALLAQIPIVPATTIAAKPKHR